MCFLNSIVQILRQVPEYLNELETLRITSQALNSLHMLYQNCGSNNPVSAMPFRQQLANATRKNINSGGQHDVMEILGFILNLRPTNIFRFHYRYECRFIVNNQAACCPICKTNPMPPPDDDIVLKLPLPKSWNNQSSPLTLQNLLNRHFQIRQQSEERQCSTSQCPTRLPYKEKLCITNYPKYLIVQLLRMDCVNDVTVKNSIQVHIPDSVVVDKMKYEIIGSVTHQGTANAGHNRAFLKQGPTWFLFEDSFPSVPKKPVESEREQNYCLLLRKFDPPVSDCHQSYFIY